MSIAAALGLGLAASLLWSQTDAMDSSAEISDRAKPKIQLMTSLPIIWGEGGSMQDIISGTSEPAAIYRHWAATYDIDPVDSFEALAKSGSDLVILAQPPAMAPADLADFDTWVRAGGKAIILTDPALLWHSELPLGDTRRPLTTGLLSPLLDHWGLVLNAQDHAQGDIAMLGFKGFSVRAAVTGSFANSPKKPNDCDFSQGGIIAECRIGAGEVVLIADADFLHSDLWGPNGDSAGQGTPTDSGAARLIDMLITGLLRKK